MKKITAFIAVILMTNLPISCDQRTNDCGPFPKMVSIIKELDIVVGKYDSNGFTEIESNKYNESAIRIEGANIETTEVAGIQNPFHFSMINQAYACSPIDPEPTQTISSLNISSESSVFIDGKEVEAGSSLNEYFKVLYYGGRTVEEFLSFEINAYDSFGHLGSSFYLMLNQQPDQPINQKMQIKLNLSDDVVFDLETEDFKVD